MAIATTVIGASALVASAASLGGVDVSDLFVHDSDVALEIPTPIAFDSFTNCHGGSFDGWVDSLGNVWTDHGGDWQCLANEMVRARARVRLGHVSLDVGHSDGIAVSTYINNVSHQRNRSGPGIALFVDGRDQMYVIYERDKGEVTLGINSAGARQILVSASVGDRDNTVMSVIVDQPMLIVLLDGIPVFSYDLTTLSSADPTFFASTRFGLVADNDNQSRFDNFRVELLP